MKIQKNCDNSFFTLISEMIISLVVLQNFNYYKNWGFLLTIEILRVFGNSAIISISILLFGNIFGR